MGHFSCYKSFSLQVSYVGALQLAPWYERLIDRGIRGSVIYAPEDEIENQVKVATALMEESSRIVLDGHTADLLIVSARVDKKMGLFIEDARSEGVSTRYTPTMDQTRKQASIWTGLATWLLGFGTAFSFNIWADVKLFGMTFFDHLDFLTSNLMLPLGGICIAIFAGWLMTKETSQAELDIKSKVGYSIWQVLIRFVAPIAVSIVLFHAIGIF